MKRWVINCLLCEGKSVRLQPWPNICGKRADVVKRHKKNPQKFVHFSLSPQKNRIDQRMPTGSSTLRNDFGVTLQKNSSIGGREY
jgi:hypothetical protein